MKTILLFPGQGSQYVGMGNTFKDSPKSKLLIEQANDLLGFDFSKILFEGPEITLKQTENTQPALFLTSMLVFQLFEELDVKFDFLAGHSLGEYSALCASKVFSFEDGLKLVRLRGELMAKAGDRVVGSMTAIIGLDIDKIEEALTSCREEGEIVVANYNSKTQTVISGEIPALEKAEGIIRELGAKKVVRLPVSGAFHSPLMNCISAELKEGLNKVSFQNAQFPVISNLTAKEVTDSETIKDLLLKQIIFPVRWTESVNYMLDLGVKQGLELGAGKVLKGLLRGITRDINVTSIETLEQLESIKKDGIC